MKRSKILLHVPDILCGYRILASVTGLLLGPNWLTPWLFPTALVSDLWDGWFYRKFVANCPEWKPWNRLPLTFDPIADVTLICCGVIFGSKYYLQLTALGVLGLFLLTGAVSIGFVLMNIVAKFTGNSFLKALSPTLQTHVSCFLMVYTTMITWKVVYGSWGGGISRLHCLDIFAFLDGNTTSHILALYTTCAAE